MDQTKTYQRGTRADDMDTGSKKDSKAREDIIQKELKSLFKTGRGVMSLSDVMRLREKYSDEKLIDEIYESYYNQWNEIRKQAKRFAELIAQKYGSQHYPLHKVLE